MTKINARQLIGTYPPHPEEEGEKLATHLLAIEDWSDLEVDIFWVATENITSHFWHSLLHRIYTANPELIKKFPFIRWTTAYDWQRKNLDQCLRSFIDLYMTRMEDMQEGAEDARNCRVKT